MSRLRSVHVLTAGVLLTLMAIVNGPVSAMDVVNSAPAAVKARLEKGPAPLILDVRTPEEYASGHLAGAVLLPVDQVDAKVDAILKSASTEVVVYCATGGRSAAASKVLKGKGYTRVTNMAGGIVAWKAAGYPVVTK